MMAYWKIPVLLVLVGALVLVRVFETQFFYDPFMYFYHNAHLDPEIIYTPVQWFFNVLLRYILNSLISLAILYVVFQSWTTVKFAGILFVILGLILYPLFIFLMGRVEPNEYIAVFYVRRFLVQPIFILIFLPAFYYQRLSGK